MWGLDALWSPWAPAGLLLAKMVQAGNVFGLNCLRVPLGCLSWQCLFCFWFKTFPLPQSSARTTFGKLCQRPIELEEFSENCRSLNFGAMGLCWRDIDVLQSYKEQIQEKLKCMAQPYKMEVLTEVGWILCWRDRELWLFYRELRWRMVKMVRNAYGIAMPEKKYWFSWKNKWKVKAYIFLL